MSGSSKVGSFEFKNLSTFPLIYFIWTKSRDYFTYSPLIISSWALSSETYSFNVFMITQGSIYWFFFKVFFMHSSCFANRHVETLSPIILGFGFIVAIILVLQFPPMELFKAIVKSESRYGTCIFFPIDCYPKAMTTLLRTWSPKLILIP